MNFQNLFSYLCMQGSWSTTHLYFLCLYEVLLQKFLKGSCDPKSHRMVMIRKSIHSIITLCCAFPGAASGERNLKKRSLSLLNWTQDFITVFHGCCGQISAVLGFPGCSESKESAGDAGGPGSISGLGRSPGEGNDYPLQDSCLEHLMDRGARWATIHGVKKSQTWSQN